MALVQGSAITHPEILKDIKEAYYSNKIPCDSDECSDDCDGEHGEFERPFVYPEFFKKGKE